MAGPTLKLKECNFVDNDLIWINHCKNEGKSSKIWSEKWGFLLEDYLKFEKESRALASPDGSAKESEVLQQAERTPVVNSQQSAPEQKTNFPQTGIPKTTTGMLSWLLVSGKSPLLTTVTDPRRGKHDILNQLGWPLDGVN